MRAPYPYNVPVGSHRGAPFGRPSIGEAPAPKLLIARPVPLEDGYDGGGAYWGGRPPGVRLWCVFDPERAFVRYLDGRDGAEVVQRVRAETLPPPTFTFGPHDGPGDSCAIEVDGFTVTARIESDDGLPPPWEAHDGHGEVSEWRSGHRSEHGYPHKQAGEMVLITDGRSARFYNFAAACRTARLDGWGCVAPEGLTRRQVAAKAAAEDFARLKAWCNDEWCWVGVVLEVERADVTLGRASLWGIESDAGDYFNTIAGELLSEALDAARAKLTELAA